MELRVHSIVMNEKKLAAFPSISSMCYGYEMAHFNVYHSNSLEILKDILLPRAVAQGVRPERKRR